MTRSSRTIRTSATLTGSAAVELIASPARPIRVIEVGIAIVNATASTFALGRPAAKGITPTSPVSLLPYSNGDVINTSGKLAVAWGTDPTIPAAYFRQCSLPATAGSERIWKFDSMIFTQEQTGGILIPASGSLILWTLSAVSIADVYFVTLE